MLTKTIRFYDTTKEVSIGDKVFIKHVNGYRTGEYSVTDIKRKYIYLDKKLKIDKDGRVADSDYATHYTVYSSLESYNRIQEEARLKAKIKEHLSNGCFTYEQSLEIKKILGL